MKKKCSRAFRFFLMPAAAAGILMFTVFHASAAPVDENLVDITIPGEINIHQSADGDVTVSDFSVENNSIVDFIINSVDADVSDGWTLAEDESGIQRNEKKLSFEIGNNRILEGNNKISLSAEREKVSVFAVSAVSGGFTSSFREKIMRLTFSYEIVPDEFEVILDAGNGTDKQILTGKNGEILTLPVPVKEGDKFQYWEDIYTGTHYTDIIKVPIGGTELHAVWQPAVCSADKLGQIEPLKGGHFIWVPSEDEKISYKTIRGLEFRKGIEIPDGCESWDVSEEGDGSVMAYRNAAGSSSQMYEYITVASDSDRIILRGDLSEMLFSYYHDYGYPSQIRSFKVEGLTLEIDSESMEGMFKGCHYLTDISGFENTDISKVKDMSGIFDNCRSLEDISSLESLDVSGVQKFDSAFAESNISDISPLADWDVRNVTSARQMFYRCDKMKTADLRKWEPLKLSEYYAEDMFDSTSLIRGYAKTQLYADIFNSGVSRTIFAAPYTITFVAEGTAAPAPMTVFTGDIVELPVPQKSGFRFTGWKDLSGNIYQGNMVMPKGDQTFTAQWKTL